VNMLIVHLGEHTVVEVTLLISPMLAIYVQAIALRQHKMSYMLCRILYHLIWIGCQERITYAVVCVKLKTVPKCTLTHGWILFTSYCNFFLVDPFVVLACSKVMQRFEGVAQFGFSCAPHALQTPSATSPK
jgi:hypothetical protein